MNDNSNGAGHSGAASQSTNAVLSELEVRIPNPRRSDFGGMHEAYGAVFCYLVLRGWNQNVKRPPLKTSEVGAFLGLHDATVGDAIRELHARGFIELTIHGQPAALLPPD